METRGNGDTGTRRHGEMETRGHGDMGKWRYGDTEIWRQGEKVFIFRFTKTGLYLICLVLLNSIKISFSTEYEKTSDTDHQR